jgi:hypothetical protein
MGQRDLVRNWQNFAIHDNLRAATKTRQEDLDRRSLVGWLVYCTGFCIRTIPRTLAIHEKRFIALFVAFLLLRTPSNPSYDIFLLQGTAVHFA